MRRALITGLVVAAIVCAGLGWRLASASPKADPVERVAAPVLSIRRTPDLAAGLAADARARTAIDQVLSSGGPPTAAGGQCVAVERGGRRVVDRRTDQPLIPASTLKLLTASAAIDVLGAETRFATAVRAADRPDGGVIKGPLFLIGGGDPLLFTAEYAATLQDRRMPSTRLEGLADAIVAAGVREVRGGVVGDDRRFDGQRAITSWEPAYTRQGLVGPIGALLVDQGFERGRNPVADPALHAAQRLQGLLVARGVVVTAGPGAGQQPKESEEIASVASAPLVEIVAEMLTESDNTTAEVLLKDIAVEARRRGTTIDGVSAVREALEEDRVDLRQLSIGDGSGLDRENRVTCETIIDTLTADGAAGPVAAGLARAGESGTLVRRMNGSSAVGRVRAKTGTLSGVSALAGWVSPPPGADGATPSAFAIIANGVDGDAQRVLEDRFAMALAALPPLPSGEAYAPGG